MPKCCWTKLATTTDFSSLAFPLHFWFGLLSLTRNDRHRLGLRRRSSGPGPAAPAGLAPAVHALVADRRGVTAVEYAVVIGTLALAIITGFATLSLKLKAKMEVLPL